MNKLKFIIIILITPVFFIQIKLTAELRKVTLDECINIAVHNHPELKASDEDSYIAQALYGLAKARNSPVVNLSVKTIGGVIDDGQSNQTSNILDTANNFDISDPNSSIGLYAGPEFIYSLYDPQASGIIDSARISFDLSKMKSFKTRYDIILNVKTNYYNYLFAKENRIKRDLLVEKFDTKLKNANALLKTGQRTNLDVTKAEVDLADARLEYEKAKNYENIIKIELLSSMGILEEDIEFSPVEIVKLPDLIPLKKLYQLADVYNPDLRIAKMTRDINRLNIDVARDAHYPNVDLVGALGIENSQILSLWGNPFTDKEINDRIIYEKWNKTIFLAVRLKFNIWSGGAINYNIDLKAAEYNKSKYVEQKISIKIRALIRNYFQSISEFKNQVELSDIVINNSRKHLALIEKSYKNGIGTQLDIQDAEMALLNSELSFVKARYEYLTTLAKLANIIGLDEEYICLK